MGVYLAASILVIALYIAFEIHRERRRRGKSGIPFLGYIFDSVTVNVYEEILDECESSGASSKSGGKKHSKKRRHRSHKHHKCSKKHKHRKSKQLQLGSTAMELVEENTQKSEKSDRTKKSSKALKKQLKANDSMDVVKSDMIPASVKNNNASKSTD